MYQVTLIGSGKIGSAITKLLHYSGDYDVWVGDSDADSLQRLAAAVPVNIFEIDATDEVALATKLEGQDCVISACPYWLNGHIARAAAQAKVSYFDLTEDVAITTEVRAIAAEADPTLTFAPQCGLAPGFVSILANHLTQQFDKVDEVKIRVGALPQYPTNMMGYNLTWSTRGLINEYCHPCDAIQNGKSIKATPLEELEQISLDGDTYEAFNTSGGLGTLCETLAGQVRTLNYKTLRYPGHCYLMSFLVNELQLGKQQEVLEKIMEEAIPLTQQDVVIISCIVTGWREGRFYQLNDVYKVYPQTLYDEIWTAIQLTTAGSICATVDICLKNKDKYNGFLKQEQIDLDLFLNNRFGRLYLEGALTREQ